MSRLERRIDNELDLGSIRSSPRNGIGSIFNKNMESKYLAGWIKGIILGTRLLSFEILGLIDKLLLEHLGLPHVLDPSIRFYCQPKSFGLDFGTLDFGLGLDNCSPVLF